MKAAWLLGMGWAVVCLASSDISEPVSYDKVAAYLKAHPEVKTVEALLPALPISYRENFTLMRESKSLQEASGESPRVIFYGLDGSFLLAMAGEKEFAGGDVLETIQFRKEMAAFEFHEIKFADSGVKLSAANPSQCLSCHGGRDGRPNWERYPTWPGAYGADHDYIENDEHFQKFLQKTKDHPRYRFLEGVVEPNGVRWRDADRNVKMTQRTAMLNMQRVIRLLKALPGYEKFKYALSAVTECPSNEIADMVPDSLRTRFLDFPTAERELREKMGGSEYDAVDKIFPFLKRLGLATEHWSMDYLSEYPGFSTPGAPNQEFYGWWTFGDPDLLPYFPRRDGDYRGVYTPHASLEGQATCGELRELSRRVWAR